MASRGKADPVKDKVAARDEAAARDEVAVEVVVVGDGHNLVSSI